MRSIKINIDLYLDKDLTFTEIKNLIEHSNLNFIKEVTIKNECLNIKGDNFSLTIESNSCTSDYSVGFLQEDEVFIHSELIENFKIKPLTTVSMYCSNDGIGFDNFCALIGCLQTVIKANYIAMLEDTCSEDFSQSGECIVMRDDYIDSSCLNLYKRLLNGDLDR